MDNKVFPNNTNDNIIYESFLGKIGKKIRERKDDKETNKKWNNANGKLKHGTYHSKNVTDSDFNEIVECFNKMKSSDKYNEYKKWFDKACKMCMIPTDGCIIQHYSFKHNGDDKNEVCITYSNTRQKITIPSGSTLFHNSTNHDIKELQPFFKGKAARGFLYSTPRVYLTIREKYPKVFADLKGNEKTSLYRVKENIQTAYVDPLVPGYKFGAVYVETNFPIPVEKIKSEVKESVKDDIIESFNDKVPNFASLEEFVEYYGLELVEDYDIIEESFKSKIGSIERTLKDKEFLKKRWKELLSKKSIKSTYKNISVSDYKKINDNFNTIKTSKEYSKYKSSYEYICKCFGLQPSDTNIIDLSFDDSDSGFKKATIKYTTGNKKVIIPNGTILTYTSSNNNIKELMPKIYTKSNGMFLFPSKRVYFNLDKEYNITSGNVNKYSPEEPIKTAYIDTSLSKFTPKCVYIDTQFPIPVKNLTKEAKGILKSLQNKKI